MHVSGANPLDATTAFPPVPKRMQFLTAPGTIL